MPLSQLSRELAGRVAVVTGAGSGMGRAVAQLFADLGVRSALADVSEAGVLAVEQELLAAGADAKAFVVDLAHASEIKRFAQSVLAHFGDVDILINNAGVGGPCSTIEGKDEEFERRWSHNLAVNLMAQVRLVRAFGPSLKRLGQGRVVNIASTEGMGATLLNTPYVASKHGSVGLTKALAVELASQGICVNCVMPGPIRTGMTDTIPERQKELYSKRLVPMRRYGLPEEVAHVVISLCLPAFRWVNGAIIPADGGLLANNALLPMKLPWKEVTELPDNMPTSKL